MENTNCHLSFYFLFYLCKYYFFLAQYFEPSLIPSYVQGFMLFCKFCCCLILEFKIVLFAISSIPILGAGGPKIWILCCGRNSMTFPPSPNPVLPLIKSLLFLCCIDRVVYKMFSELFIYSGEEVTTLGKNTFDTGGSFKNGTLCK